MQVYDGPEFPVVHADFYRLRGAEELAQLGWDEAIEGAVTLVEWPERAAERAAAPTGSRSRSISTPRDGPDFRRAEMRARGALGVRCAARARDRDAARSEPAGPRRERVPLARRRLDPRLRAPDRARRRAPRS